MDNYRNHLVLRKEFVKVIPSHQFLFNLFINDIFNNCDKYGISIGDKRCCGGFFLQMTLCYVHQQDSQLKKLLKFSSKWAINNEMQFGINKCAGLVVRGEVSRFLNNSNPFLFLSFKSRVT